MSIPTSLCWGALGRHLTAFYFHLAWRAGRAPLSLVPFHLHWAVGCPLSQRAQAAETQGVPTRGRLHLDLGSASRSCRSKRLMRQINAQGPRRAPPMLGLFSSPVAHACSHPARGVSARAGKVASSSRTWWGTILFIFFLYLSFVPQRI